MEDVGLTVGIADSPLKDRVVFVNGAPRSGTSWLTAILAVHPDVGGQQAESHLFDRGVDRLFDNHAGNTPQHAYLERYVTHDELVDLVRDLCDGILVRMHARTKPEARLILEKTPVGERRPRVEMERKLRCYPDARYIHIVRDGEAVADSMLRTPWMQGRSRADCLRVWQEAVEGIRAALQGHPGYFELSYERLRDDPLGQSAELFRWLGLPAGEEVLERVAAASREHHAPWQAESAQRGPSRRSRVRARLPRASSLRGLPRRESPRHADAENEQPSPVNAFIDAFSAADAEAIARVAGHETRLTIRTPVGDVHMRSGEAAPVLAGFAKQVFGGSFVASQWALVDAGMHSFWFSGTRADASRVDLSVALKLEGGRITDVGVLSAGDPAGRRPTQWVP